MKDGINDSEFTRVRTPQIFSRRCVSENGRIVYLFQIAAPELGRGRLYPLKSGCAYKGANHAQESRSLDGAHVSNEILSSAGIQE